MHEPESVRRRGSMSHFLHGSTLRRVLVERTWCASLVLRQRILVSPHFVPLGLE